MINVNNNLFSRIINGFSYDKRMYKAYTLKYKVEVDKFLFSKDILNDLKDVEYIIKSSYDEENILEIIKKISLVLNFYFLEHVMIFTKKVF